MGKPAAKKGDKIVSAPGDIHLIQPPVGPPLPVPHPCKSDIKMKVAKKVNVQGKAGAMKGSKSKHMPPHVPIGGTFVNPPKNEGEVFTASTNVNYEGRGAAMLGDTALMCCDPTDMPIGYLVVPPGTVYVGGGMSGLEAARADARIAAMKAAAAKCHEWICANMPLGEDREAAHRKVCESTGHPVDVPTGKVFTGVTILRLRGRIPVLLALDYSTARAHEDGPFGHGWRLALERHLLITDDFIGHRNEHGHFAAFAPIGPGEEAESTAEGLTLRHHGPYLTVRNARGLEDVFRLPEGHQGAMLPLAGVRDGFGNGVRLHYDGQRLATITDSAGREVLLTYGAANRVTQVLLKDDPRVAARPVATCRYDAAGDLVAVGDPLGHERRMAYDRHLLVRETDRNGFSFYFAYDDRQRCILTWGDGGALYRRLSYDPERQLSHVIDSGGGQTLHRWNAGGQVEDTVDPLGSAWSKVLDDQGHVLSSTDPLGRSWTFAYDEGGRMVERNDPAGDNLTVARDEAGRIRQLGYDTEPPLEIEHDPATGMVKRIATGGDGPVLTYAWTERGDLGEIRRDDRLVWRYDYDAQGNRTLVEQPGGIRQVHDYEHAGRLARIENNRGLAIRFGWDAAGRLTTVQRPGCAPEERALDAEGNIVSRRRGHSEVELGYVGWNLPAMAKGQGIRQEHSLAYDQELRLVRLRTGSGGEHGFEYDLCGRPIVHRYPDGGIAHAECDAAGRAIAAIDRAGRKATFAYDDAGNVIERAESCGQITRWLYDDRRRLAQTSNDTVACETAFDDTGRANRQLFTFVDGPELALSLDDGWLTAEDTGLQFAHIGDGGRVGATSCSAWSRPVLYLPGDQSVEIRYPNGVRETIRFHAGGRRLAQEITGPKGAPINRRRYGYDAAGRLVTVEDALRGKADYVYDSTERLREVVREGSGRSERHHYDAAENLSRGDQAWQFDPSCRLLTRPGHRYAHDRCGNRCEERGPGGATTRYHYDARNRLIAADLPDGRRVDYGYDATGRRVRKRIGDLTTYYLWNGDLMVAERRSDGAARTYIHPRGGNAPLAWVDEAGDSQQSCFVHNDHLGRPLEVTDEDGRLVWAADYDAFGAVARMIVGEVEQPVRAPGQYADEETGLYYNHQRYLDPAAVRFLSEDPLGLDAGFNPYAYCPNPITQIDPLGHCTGSNPAYDPKQAEIDAIRRLYYGSEGHQLMTQALRSGDIEDVFRAADALGRETGWRWEAWIEPVGRRAPGAGDDPGMIDWQNRRVLIDLNAPTPRIAETMSHEYNALRIVQDEAAQRGVEVPTTRHEALRLIPQAANYPIGGRHEVMDSYVEDPQAFERFLADNP